MPHLGPMEMGLILIVLLLVFGAGRLPEVGRSLGRSIVEFRRGAAAETRELGEGQRDAS